MFKIRFKIIVISIVSFLSISCSKIVKDGDIRPRVCKANTFNDGMSFAELLEIASASTDCNDAVGAVIKAKYDQTMFIIEGPFVDKGEKDMDEEATSIRFRSERVVKFFFIRFGDIIRRLRISFEHIDLQECEQIIILVNNRCTNSLVELSLENCKGDMFSYLTRPLTKVFQLSFSSSKTVPLNKNTLPHNFTSIFTSLSDLELGHMTESDWEYIGNCKWPTVVDLNIILRKPVEQNTEDSIRLISFLKKNQQIDYLSVHNANLNVFKEASRLLPKLIFLRIKGLSEDYLNFHGDPVHFENVKLVTYETDDENELPEMIAFDHLDHLTLVIPNFTDKWIKFITNQVHNNLTFLTLSTEIISKSDLLTIPKILKELRKVIISCQLKLNAYDIVSFIEKSQFLNCIQLKVLMDDSEEQRLDETIPINWDRPTTQKPPNDQENTGQKQIIIEKLLDCAKNESLKKFDMNNLIKRSRVSGNCMDKARERFNEKYVNTMFSIDGPFVERSEIFEDGKREVYIMNFGMIKFLMYNFGNYIHRVSISFASIDVKHGKEIVQLLNDKSKDSLEEIELHSCRDDILDKMKTFNNVFTLTYSSDAYEERPISSKTQKLYKIAPNIYSLTLKRILTPDWAFINGVFKDLRKVNVKLRKIQELNEIDTLHVVNFIQMNPTIGVLAIENISLQLLKLTNDFLPQLESLYIANLADNYMNYHGDPVSFQNLKFLSINSDDGIVPTKIAFYYLETLSLMVYDMNDTWMEFLEKRINPNLSVLELTVRTIEIDQLLSISGKIFRFLEHVRFISPIKLKADTVKSFIENGEKLFDVILKVRMDMTERDRLNEILVDNLNVKFFPVENQEVFVDIKMRSDSEYCEPDSLNGESVSDLLEKSKLDRQCLEEARKSFKSYSHFTFTFVGPFIKDEEEAFEVYDDHENIIIRNFKVCKEMLTNFGHLIRKLRVNFQNMDAETGMQLVEAIGVKCFESLTALELINCKENMLDGLTSQYNNLLILRLTSSVTDALISIVNRRLGMLFPKLEKLSVAYEELRHFQENINTMTALDVNLPRKASEMDEAQIGHFFKINKQIESLGIHYTTLKLLHEVKENIPELKSLSLIKLSEDFYNFEIESVHFDKLSRLSVYSEDCPENVMFNQLEMLDLFIEPSNFDEKWLNFLTNHVHGNLTFLTLTATKLNKEHFFTIAEKLHNLETVFISSTSKFTANDIISFIEKCKFLTNLDMKIEMSESEKKRLMNILPNTWERIGQIQVDKITLKREPWIMGDSSNAANGTDDKGITTNAGSGDTLHKTIFSIIFSVLVIFVFIVTLF